LVNVKGPVNPNTATRHAPATAHRHDKPKRGSNHLRWRARSSKHTLAAEEAAGGGSEGVSPGSSPSQPLVPLPRYEEAAIRKDLDAASPVTVSLHVSARGRLGAKRVQVQKRPPAVRTAGRASRRGARRGGAVARAREADAGKARCERQRRGDCAHRSGRARGRARTVLSCGAAGRRECRCFFRALFSFLVFHHQIPFCRIARP
jgi:hypothetical protein